MTDGAAADRITVAPLTLPRLVAFVRFRRAVDETGGATVPPPTNGGSTAPDVCKAGSGGCALEKFLDGTADWPIALRAIGVATVIAPAWPRDACPGPAVFAPGLIIRICCCVTPCG